MLYAYFSIDNRCGDIYKLYDYKLYDYFLVFAVHL